MTPAVAWRDSPLATFMALVQFKWKIPPRQGGEQVMGFSPEVGVADRLMSRMAAVVYASEWQQSAVAHWTTSMDDAAVLYRLVCNMGLP